MNCRIPRKCIPVCLTALFAASLAVVMRPLPAQNDAIPAEVTALFNDIADIDKLRVLNPLNLKSEQLEKISALIRKYQNSYITKLADASVPKIKEIAKDIKETRRKMLGGAPLPKDLDEKVKKIQDQFVEQRDKEEKAVLQNISREITAVLSADQKAKAVSLAKNAFMKDGKMTAKGTEDSFFYFYVLNVFIKNPRAVQLLDDMRAERSGAE